MLEQVFRDMRSHSCASVVASFATSLLVSIGIGQIMLVRVDALTRPAPGASQASCPILPLKVLDGLVDAAARTPFHVQFGVLSVVH
jgi:hypothetical protein